MNPVARVAIATGIACALVLPIACAQGCSSVNRDALLCQLGAFGTLPDDPNTITLADVKNTVRAMNECKVITAPDAGVP